MQRPYVCSEQMKSLLQNTPPDSSEFLHSNYYSYISTIISLLQIMKCLGRADIAPASHINPTT